MIKIIKKGTRRQATCETCGCIFSYEAEDINPNCAFPGMKPGYKNHVICPQCHNDIIVSQTRCILAESEEQNGET